MVHQLRQTCCHKHDTNLSMFIGPTTGAIVALEKDLKVFHVCFDSVLESYSEKLWPMLDVNQLNTNMFEYKLKKKDATLKKIGFKKKG